MNFIKNIAQNTHLFNKSEQTVSAKLENTHIVAELDGEYTIFDTTAEYGACVLDTYTFEDGVAQTECRYNGEDVEISVAEVNFANAFTNEHAYNIIGNAKENIIVFVKDSASVDFQNGKIKYNFTAHFAIRYDDIKNLKDCSLLDRLFLSVFYINDNCLNIKVNGLKKDVVGSFYDIIISGTFEDNIDFNEVKASKIKAFDYEMNLQSEVQK